MQEPSADAIPFAITRLGTLMRPEPQDPDEAWGVLNPGCARARDNQLYLFPREVGEGNTSRIGIGKVHFGPSGNPVAVERIAHALDPAEHYEFVTASLYGCEDARVVYVPLLDRYVMTYVALSSMGPRVALAISADLLVWRRLGLVDFLLEDGVDLNVYGNKDALLVPEPVTDPEGRPALALIHRPMYSMMTPNRMIELPKPAGVAEPRDSMWISYSALDAVHADPHALTQYAHHQVLATPQAHWENVKIGGGAPPLLTHLGWLVVYHGVQGDALSVFELDPRRRNVRYCAGVLVLDREDPRKILYRSPDPILEPVTSEERNGVARNVVFPTGVDPRTPPAPGSRVDVYYGMADTAVGVGYLTLPKTLPVSRTSCIA